MSTNSCDILTLYLVWMYGIAVFIGINHCKRHRHSVSNKCDGYCVSSDVRESVHGRHPWLWESEDRRIQIQIPWHFRKKRCLFFFFSKRLPSWDVANDLNVVRRIQREGVGHTCSYNHLRGKDKTMKYNLITSLRENPQHSKIQMTNRKDLHRDWCTKALSVTHVDFFNYHQNSQTHHGDQQLRHVGVRQVLHHWR